MGDGPFTETGRITISKNNSKPTPPRELQQSFSTTFDKEGKEPMLLKESIDCSNGIIESSCRVEKGAGRNETTGLVINGTPQPREHNYVYYEIFNVQIKVKPGTVLRYWICPKNEGGQRCGIDLGFEDGSNLRDSSATDQYEGSLHPGATKGSIGIWTRIECPIGQWMDGKTIQKIMLAYDHTDPHGSFCATVDDLEIGEPKEVK